MHKSTDGSSLLRNIETAVEQGLPLQTGFFNAETINRFFGTNQAEQQLNTETTTLWLTRRLGYVPVREDSRKPRREQNARLSDIEAVFGSDN